MEDKPKGPVFRAAGAYRTGASAKPAGLQYSTCREDDENDAEDASGKENPEHD